MALFRFALWLAYWYTQSEKFGFEWDNANTNKILSKHGIEPFEVEAVFDLKLGVPLGRQERPKVDEERLCVVGPSLDGRMLSVVFTLRDGRVRTISARPASRKERKLYEEVRKTLESI